MSDPERSWQALRGDTDRGEGAGVEASASGADSQRPASEMRTEAVPFPQFVAAPGQPTMTTWEDASGEPIFGEFDFMCDRLWIDDADVEEPIEFTRTEWVAVRRTKSWRSEDRPVCPSCHGEGETPSGAACGRCLGEGFFAEPIEEVVSDERWLVEITDRGEGAPYDIDTEANPVGLTVRTDPAASAPLSGCWFAYNYDGSSCVPFLTELDAYRYASPFMMPVKFVEWGGEVFR